MHMLRLFFVALCVWSVTLSPAFAKDEPSDLDPPRATIGGGVGFVGLLHVDYQRWVKDHTSIEVGLTPMILHNVAAVALTRHIDMGQGGSGDQHLLVSGTLGGMVNLAGVAAGPGVRVGYERLTGRFRVSLAAGAIVAIHRVEFWPMGGDVPWIDRGEFAGKIIPDVRLTFWAVKR